MKTTTGPSMSEGLFFSHSVSLDNINVITPQEGCARIYVAETLIGYIVKKIKTHILH